ncbi:restriction endonuclease subunit S [Klebsiella aerogenes]
MIGGKLPEGWVGSSLGDVLDVNSGVGFPIKFQGKNSGDYPVYKVSDISVAVTKNNGNLSTAGHYISKEEAVELKGKIFRPGSTAFAKIGEAVKLNRRAIVQSPGLADNNVMVISAVLHEMDKFIFHFMNTIDLSEQARSTTVPSIRKGDIEDIRLALPSISEQKTIAEKLDTLLAQVDSTKARLEQIRQILKRFRQAVLAAAVSGRLTKVWREKNQDSSSSGEWQQFALSELGVLSRGKSKHRPRNDPRLFGDTYPFIQTGEVANSSGRIKAATKFYSEFGLSQSKLFPQGTLCITIAANIANTAILDIDACFPDSVVGFIPKKNKAHILFIKYLIDANKEDLEAYAPATAQKNINLKVLNDLRFPIPDIEEQHEIVRRVEQLFACADTIEKQVNSALTRVKSLTQSILAKAFRGELTAQWRAENPDLISGENSAAALLEKIKAERAASGGKKTSRKKA